MAYCYSCKTTNEEDFAPAARQKSKSFCRRCVRERSQRYNAKHPGKSKSRCDSWRNKHPNYAKRYYAEHKDSYREYNREWEKNRYHNDVNYNTAHKLRRTLSGRIRTALCNGRELSTVGLLGCSIAEFREHLERQFSSDMTWNHFLGGQIHIDHIQPVASFDLTDEAQQRKCFHFTNLQPLWAEDNRIKGDKEYK